MKYLTRFIPLRWRNTFLTVILLLFFPGKATISNDGATIMKLLDIVHPAAKTLVDIAKSQDAEVRKMYLYY